MAKTCTSIDCTYPVFGKGLCKGHQWKRTDKKPKVNKPVKIKPMSKKLSKERKTYRELRLEYLERPENIFCAVYPDLRADQIHHTRGRGKNLNKTETWLAVSAPGHQWIEENPKLAKERGFTKSRLSMTDHLNENLVMVKNKEILITCSTIKENKETQKINTDAGLKEILVEHYVELINTSKVDFKLKQGIEYNFKVSITSTTKKALITGNVVSINESDFTISITIEVKSLKIV